MEIISNMSISEISLFVSLILFVIGGALIIISVETRQSGEMGEVGVAILVLSLTVLIVTTIITTMEMVDYYDSDETEIQESVIFEITEIKEGVFLKLKEDGGGTPKYQIMAKIDNGKSLKEIEVDDVILIEDSKEKPRYVEEKVYRIRKSKSGKRKDDKVYEETKYKIYVPKINK